MDVLRESLSRSGEPAGPAPGVPYSRESCLLVPYQRVCVHPWGASGIASLGWGSSLLPCCSAALLF